MNSKNHSEILEDILFLIYPLILVFGIYVILEGTKLPGGGFQGGAILVAVFMSRYLVSPITMESINTIKKLDKIMLIFILICVLIFFIYGGNQATNLFKDMYNIVLSVLIGVKVGSGLTVIFYTFVDIEGGDED